MTTLQNLSKPVYSNVTERVSLSTYKLGRVDGLHPIPRPSDRGHGAIGQSTDWYFVGPEIPRFIQEQYVNLLASAAPVAASRDDKPERCAAGYRAATVTSSTPTTRERAALIMPQAARFRVFAYIYSSRESEPYKVLELKPRDADIEWVVSISNEKSVAPDGKTLTPNRPGGKPLSTKAASPPTNCKVGAKPNLAWLALEKDAAGNPTGRLHVIGNEGEASGGPLKGDPDFNGAFPDPFLFQNDWLIQQRTGRSRRQWN